LKLNKLEGLCNSYIDDSIACLSLLKDQRSKIAGVISQLIEARNLGRNIFIIGNGGSASTASHMACDLNKTAIREDSKRFRAFALTDNVPVMTAWANDKSYGDVFKEQLSNLLSANDVLVAISGSGNSENVVEAIKLAKRKGALTIGFTGFKGGRMKRLVDTCVIVPSDLMYRIEDVHLMLNHLVTYVLLSM
jgi:D-sedoheptulose 7-phosphate isomerase